MILFGWKKKYDSLLKELNAKNEVLMSVQEIVKEISTDNDKKLEKIKHLESILDIKAKNIVELEQKIKELSLSNESLESENKEIYKLNASLFKQIQDLKSDRYLKVKLPPDKSKSSKKMGIKRGVTKKSVKKELKAKNESEEK